MDRSAREDRSRRPHRRNDHQHHPDANLVLGSQVSAPKNIFAFRSPELKNVSRETFSIKPQRHTPEFDHPQPIRQALKTMGAGVTPAQGSGKNTAGVSTKKKE